MFSRGRHAAPRQKGKDLRRFGRAIPLALAFVMTMGAVAAFADTITISNHVSLDQNVTKDPGTTGTAHLRLDTTNGTPSGDTNGCNAQSGTNMNGSPLVVALQSSNPKVALASPGSVTFTECGQTVGIGYTVAADAVGTATISVSAVSGGKNDGTRTYSTSDTLVITINGPTCTTPAVPTINAADGALGLNGWYTAAPSLSATGTGVQWATAVNGGSKSAFSSTVPTLGVGTTIVYAKAVDGACQSAEASLTFQVDPNAPSITDNGFSSGTAGTNGWYTSAIAHQFTASEPAIESGLPSSITNPFTRSTGAAEGTGLTISSGAVSDVAGNENSGITTTATYDVDLSDPTNVAFSSTLSGNYYFGFVPSAPTCTADDTISGLSSCTVTGYSTVVGTHTMTATATDNAGRTATAMTSYTVLAWTTSGFYSPVDMGTDVLNTIKGGQTVPLKFELFAGTNELKLISYVSFFKTKELSCGTFSAATVDDVEITSTGGTSLRFDTTGDQFIQNWQTPKTSNKCYAATVGFQDGSSITAYFKTK